MKPLGAVLAVCAVALMACSSSLRVWTGSYSFPSNTWMEGNEVVFTPDSVSLDSTGRGMLALTFRYSATANVDEIPIIVETESSVLGHYSCDTLKVKLYEASDRTAGKARVGIFETTDTLLLKAPSMRGLEISLRPITPAEGIRGLFSVTAELYNLESQ